MQRSIRPIVRKEPVTLVIRLNEHYLSAMCTPDVRAWAPPLALLLCLLLALPLTACGDEAAAPDGEAEWLHTAMKGMTDVMVHDIRNPPQASRVYAYASIAAYEAMQPMDTTFRSMNGQLNGLADLPAPEADKEYYYPLASLQAFLTVADAMMYSRDRLQPTREYIDEKIAAQRVPRAVRERSKAFGTAVGEHVLAWANEDFFRETRGMQSFTVREEEPGRWMPTPPAYMDGIEPNWMHLRPFTLASADQFRPEPPVPFSLEEDSAFYQELAAVLPYDGHTVEGEKREIASFWDCNPYTLHVHGHAKFATKQMTPGAHWMGIAATAARQDGRSLLETAETYMLTALALADGFISNWDEKYRSSLIRPETVINQHIDEGWIPLLQTPPFPEYTSGHSVISRAASEVLTALYGDNFAYQDTVVVEYGLPVRSFDSFFDASNEAAISRLYGGIHYPMAIDEGVRQGAQVGRHLIERVETRPGMPSLAADRPLPSDLAVVQDHDAVRRP